MATSKGPIRDRLASSLHYGRTNQLYRSRDGAKRVRSRRRLGEVIPCYPQLIYMVVQNETATKKPQSKNRKCWVLLSPLPPTAPALVDRVRMKTPGASQRHWGLFLYFSPVCPTAEASSHSGRCHTPRCSLILLAQPCRFGHKVPTSSPHRIFDRLKPHKASGCRTAATAGPARLHSRPPADRSRGRPVGRSFQD